MESFIKDIMKFIIYCFGPLFIFVAVIEIIDKLGPKIGITADSIYVCKDKNGGRITPFQWLANWTNEKTRKYWLAKLIFGLLFLLFLLLASVLVVKGATFIF